MILRDLRFGHFFHHHGMALCVNNKQAISLLSMPMFSAIVYWKGVMREALRAHVSCTLRQFMGRLSRHAMSTIRVSFYAVKPFLLVFTYTKSISLSCGHLSQLRPPFQLLNLHLKLHFTPRIRMSGDRLTQIQLFLPPTTSSPLT